MRNSLSHIISNSCDHSAYGLRLSNWQTGGYNFFYKNKTKNKFQFVKPCAQLTINVFLYANDIPKHSFNLAFSIFVFDAIFFDSAEIEKLT